MSSITTTTPPSTNPLFPERPPPPTPSQIHTNLTACLTLQNTAVTQHNKRPFAALLIGPDHSTPLLSHTSISHIAHAESSLAHLASLHYSQSYLWTCTLYSTWEPCVMCTGTIYWAGIGRVVFAASEGDLARLTGRGNPENFTLGLGCREVLGRGQKDVLVVGPVEGIREVVVEASERFWGPVRRGLGLD